MHRCLYGGLLVAATICLSPANAASDAPSKADIDAMRQEIEILKRGQETIGRDVAEILKILEPLRPPLPVRPIEAVVALGESPRKGTRDAPLTLIEYSDYQCPFCKRHVDTTLPQLEREYISTGKLRYVFRDLPLESIHQQAFKSAEAARCAGEQQKYWEMHDRLFANQDSLAPKDLVEHARAIGLEVRVFRKCLDDGQYAEAIRSGMAEAEKLGMTATPGFLLGVSDGDQVKEVKLIIGAQPFAVFKAEIDKLLTPVAAEP